MTNGGAPFFVLPGDLDSLHSHVPMSTIEVVTKWRYKQPDHIMGLFGYRNCVQVGLTLGDRNCPYTIGPIMDQEIVWKSHNRWTIRCHCPLVEWLEPSDREISIPWWVVPQVNGLDNWNAHPTYNITFRAHFSWSRII